MTHHHHHHHHHRAAIKALPLATRFEGANFLAKDKARVAKFLQGVSPHGPNAVRVSGKKSSFAASSTSAGDTIDVTDAAVTYTASVGVGSPATNYTLLIDTGSSNTWVGAGTAYEKTSTSKDTGETVNVSYGSGSFSGEEYTDEVSLGEGLVIQNQSIGVASTAQGFSDVDGILGIGPVDLTEGTVSGTQQVPTVTDNLFSQGTISSNSVGISYVPTTESTNVANGKLTFGGTDTDEFTGELTFTPITSTSPAGQYWGIDQSITYGTDTVILQETAGIVDTGTTLLYLATDAFNAYQKATGATLDSTTGLLKISSSQFDNLQSLFFSIGGTTFELTANAQIWPRSSNSEIGGDEGSIYLIAADNGTNSGSGLDFINGFTWLQRFYTVFDTGNKQVGIATTVNTDAETN